MTLEARKQYLIAIRERYKKSTRKEKSKILDEYCAVCRYSRKYAVRILNGKVEPRRKKPGPKPKYDEFRFVPHLKKLWEALDRPNSKKLVAAIPDLLPYYEDPGLDRELESKLLKVSSATVDRLLKRFRIARKRGLSSTKSLSWAKSQIPLELLHKEVTKPGYFEADTVAHCGDSLSGEFIYSLTMTDIASCWTVNRAVWSKAADGILGALAEAEAGLPFPIWAIASDNGTEFLNHDLHDYLRKRKNPVKMMRRRPYQKNDNAHVEQKNWSHVRQLFGYERLSDSAMVAVMNEIYGAYWNKLHNFFIPCMKLIERKRVGSKIKKKYDKPKTPYQRILDNEEIPFWVKKRLMEEKKCYHPFKLKAELDKKMQDFVKLVECMRVTRRFSQKEEKPK